MKNGSSCAVTLAYAYDRKPLSERETIDYIRSQSGTHFDPELVAAFVKMQEG